jgi:hypothetical protein
VRAAVVDCRPEKLIARAFQGDFIPSVGTQKT